MIFQKPAILKTRVSSGGIHLFNRATGMNILVDEVSPPSYTWSKAPRYVSIALTNACDLNCNYCYAPKNPAILDFDMLISWVKELDNNGCLGIGFGGGEPTLYPKFVELCSEISNQTNLAISMTTHGHRLTECFLKKISGNIHFVRVSMDGVGKTYEALRGKPFDQLINNISALKTIVPFGINFIVNSSTAQDLDAAINLAELLGAAEFLLLPEQPTHKVKGIDKVTELLMIDWIAKYRGPVPLLISDTGLEGCLTCNPFSKTEVGLDAFAHIDALGLLKKSSYDAIGVSIGKGKVLNALEKLKES